MDMNLDKHPIPLQPSFWIVVVAAGIQPVPITNGVGVANIEFYQSRCVAYTKQDAIKAVLSQLQAEQPQLWQHGQQIGGWRVTHVDGISAQEMERLFKEHADQQRKTEEDRRKLELNEFLQRIITTKDVNLFHKAIRDGVLTDYQRAYLHEKLTEGMPKEAAELIKSPFPI